MCAASFDDIGKFSIIRDKRKKNVPASRHVIDAAIGCARNFHHVQASGGQRAAGNVTETASAGIVVGVLSALRSVVAVNRSYCSG